MRHTTDTIPAHCRKTAVFDFDHTLIDGDSLSLLLRHTFGTATLLRAMLWLAPRMPAFFLRRQNRGILKERLFRRLFGGMDYAEFRRMGEELAPALVRNENRALVEDMKHHLAEGWRVCIASASMPEWIGPWARLYDENIEIVATVPEVADGRLTGRFATPDCKGEEKARRLRERYPEWKDSFMVAYGNHPDDRAMLGLAHRRVIV